MMRKGIGRYIGRYATKLDYLYINFIVVQTRLLQIKMLTRMSIPRETNTKYSKRNFKEIKIVH